MKEYNDFNGYKESKKSKESGEMELSEKNQNNDFSMAYMGMVAALGVDTVFHIENLKGSLVGEARFGRGLGFKRYLLKDSQGKKLDRNAPCPCGSGRKAKKCCEYQSVVDKKLENLEKQEESNSQTQN